MKTIGLLGGMTFESTIPYYQVINEVVNGELGDHHSARMIMYSVDFQDVEECLRNQDWEKNSAILCEAAVKLRDAGVDFIALATNTMHMFAGDIMDATGLELVHIAEVTADRLIADGVKKVGLLGTGFTMEKEFYKGLLVEKGLEVLIPETSEEREQVFTIIDTELAFNNIREESRAVYQDIISRLKDRGAEAVILGCTEIGLLIKEEHSVLPVYDTTLIHAEEIARYALK
ncbi:MAG: aspartate/glutamate racemase family protein [Clostridiales bacterium]|nr:aspartate/glutamate racemase family protein [Candidatus Crickella merdequi]